VFSEERGGGGSPARVSAWKVTASGIWRNGLAIVME
jgi:hypothetical protein